MMVSVGVSNRHVHLCEEDYKILFGNEDLTVKSYLNQPGEFASNSVVTIKGEKGMIEKVRVLGPLREYSQVEISRTDSYKLGVKPPIRTSGFLDDASEITVIGPNGSITKNICIIANRHIHVDKDILKAKGLDGVREVSVLIENEKGGIMNHVYLKETPHAYFEMHIDTDDANALMLKQNDEVEIIMNQD